MNSLLKKITLSLLLIFLLTPLFQPTLAADADPYGLNTTAANAGLITPGTEPPRLTIMIGRVINWGLTFLGIVFMLWILVGGYIWMTAGGSEEKVKKAKMMIGAAFSGIVIVFLAYALANVIIDSLINATGTG